MSARIALACLFAFAVVLSAGCKAPAEQVPTPDVQIATAADDGPFCIYRDSMPAIVGFSYGTGSTGQAGLTEDTGPVLIWRTLYRFDLSGWSSGDADFWVYVMARYGTAPGLEFVAVDDFDSVPTQMLVRGDMSRLWNLVDSGQSLASFFTEDTGWVHVTVPAARMAAAKSASGWLGLVVKAGSEQIVPGNVQHLATFEGTSAGVPLPFLAW